jgi:hypothetical protein
MRLHPLRRPLRPALALCSILLSTLGLTIFAMPSHATEEPEYQVVREFAGIEVRQYSAYTVAEVVVAGPAGEAGNQAFPILAGYIFGKNKGERKLQMTAPVAQTSVPGGFLVQFVLPKGLTAATAPEPLDPRVQLREVLPSQVAVIRYSGFWSESNYSEHLTKLQAALRAADLAWTGEAVYSRYNAPFTPWFMRRNEIWLHLTSRP